MSKLKVGLCIALWILFVLFVAGTSTLGYFELWAFAIGCGVLTFVSFGAALATTIYIGTTIDDNKGRYW